MPYVPYAYSFARYYLKKKNIEIKKGNKIIFDYNIPMIPKGAFKINEIKPGIILGSFGFRKKVDLIRTIEELKNLDFSLYKDRNGLLYLKECGSKGGIELFKIPEGHYIEHDIKRKTLIVKGKYSRGETYDMDEGIEKVDEIGNPIFDGVLEEWDKPLKEEEIIFIKEDELPIGISDEMRSLVCIKKTGDSFNAGFVGKKGYGKSIFLNSICHFMYKLWGIPIGILNDWNYEVDFWCKRLRQETKFVNLLSKLNLRPEFLPIVFLVPSTNQKNYIEINNKLVKENVIDTFTLNWEDFINNYTEITKGYSELETGKSGTAIKWDELKKCESLEEVNDVIDSIEGGKEVASIKGRLRRVFYTLLSSGLFDIDKKNTSKYQVTKYETNEYGIKEKIYSKTENCIPSILFDARINVCVRPRELENVKVGDTQIYQAYMCFLIKQLLDIKNKREELKKRDIGIAFDELHVMTGKGVNQPFKDLMSVGRHPGIYFLWASQFYNNVMREIKTNTNYLFCMYYDEEDAKNVVKNKIGNNKKWVDEILSLKKEKFKCIVFPDSDLVCYNLDDGKRKTILDPLKISLIPPLGDHKKPGE